MVALIALEVVTVSHHSSIICVPIARAVQNGRRDRMISTAIVIDFDELICRAIRASHAEFTDNQLCIDRLANCGF